MPYKNPEDQKAWLRRRIDEGYGRAIYQVRKRHLDNERMLRAAVTDAVVLLTEAQHARKREDVLERVAAAEDVLAEALVAAPPVIRTPTSILREGK